MGCCSCNHKKSNKPKKYSKEEIETENFNLNIL